MYQKTAVSEKSHIRQETDKKENTGNGVSLPAVIPVQKAAEEELPAQGKFKTVQKAAPDEQEGGGAEDEEAIAVQGKFKTVQKAAPDEQEGGGAEDEEGIAIQGKFKTVQKAAPDEEEGGGAEDEEGIAIQGKFKTVQKAAPDEQEGGGAEDEEAIAVQGKFKTVQKAAPDEQEGGGAEDEEGIAIQGKFKTVQKAAPDEQEGGGAEEEEAIQGKFKTIQKKKTSANPFQLKEQKPNNTGLPNSLKSGVENLSGFSMDDVKVHYNSDKPKDLKAHAYAQGTDIHIGPGQEQHLPHEAWHVAQQKQGRVQPTMQMKQGVPVNDDAGLENEADVMGAKAVAQGKDMEPGTAQLRFNSSLLTGSVQRKATVKTEKTHPRPAQLNRSRSTTVTEETPEAKFMRENSGIISMITNASVILGEINWSKLAAGKTTSTADSIGSGASGVGVVGSLTGLSGTATNSIKKTSEPDIAGAAGDITSGIGSSIGSLVKTVLSIKELYKTATGSGGDKIEGGGKAAIALLAALKSGCEAAASIQKFVNGSVPPVFKSLIPGLGLAIAACEVIVNVYTTYSASTVESEMSEVSGEFKEGLATILGGEPKTVAPTLFADEDRGKFLNRLMYLRLKPGLFEQLEEILAGLSTKEGKQKEANFRSKHKLTGNTTPFNEIVAAIRYYELGSKMQEINQKRKVQGARNIFANLIAIAGEIAKFFPADGGITATVLLGTSAAIGAVQSAGKFIQGFARDKGILGGDRNRSGAQKHKEYVNHTRSLYQYMDSIKPVAEENKGKIGRAEQMLKATGVNASEIYATEYDNASSKSRQVGLIIEGMKAGR